MNENLIKDLARKYGYLQYMIERYFQFLGKDETIKLLKANDTPLTPSIRVNTLKISPVELEKKLIKKGFKLEPVEGITYVYKILKTNRNLGSTHEFLQGYYYLQNIASILSSIILDPKPNETVIDMCAAPGSKSTHLAQLMMNKGTLILIDRNKKRIPALETNLQRLGIINSIVLNMDAVDLLTLDVKADKILLDAPCTGEGLIRQDPRRKLSKKIIDIEKLASIQKKLLAKGLDKLKPQGRLLYCTCSIAPEENELVVDEVLRKKENFAIIEISRKYGLDGFTDVYGNTLISDLHHSKRLYPHVHDTIGFFYCLIQNIS
ncbi:MAG: RsmB/NOP family class I SAM-dependent RNA methyltransferase [Promethearchaeota archaeon]